MKKNYFNFSLAVLLALGTRAMAQDPITQASVAASTLASSPTISFSDSTGFADNVAQDGEGG